jgi:hypothetical protein
LQVSLERAYAGGAFETVGILPADGLVYNFEDRPGDPGPYRYRAAIRLTGRRIRYSDVAEIVLTGDAPVWIYPNPITPDAGDLIVRLSEGTPGTLYIVHGTGQIAAIAELTTFDTFVPVAGLSPGVYSAVIHRDGYPDIVRKVVVY